MPEKVYLNGKFLDADEARVTAFDTGLLHGVGLFESLRSYRGKVYHLEEHINRLKRSGEKLGIIVDGDAGFYRNIIDELIVTNALSDARIRITVTAGSVRVGVYTDAQAMPTTFVTCGPLQIPDEIYHRGVGVLLCDYRISNTDPVARHKTTSYLPRLMAMRQAQRISMADAIWYSEQGYLLGGTTGNIFLFKDDQLLTPSLDLPVFPGITRKIVLDIARETQIPVQETRISMEDTLAAQEIFLSSTTTEIMPVVAIEKHVVGAGSVGPITRTILQKYRRNVRKELDT
jgi:branched-chain amino acid aminotransferase